MASPHRRATGPEYEDGAQPVEESPADRPGTGRGVLFLVVAVLVVLVLAMPIAWGIGVLATVGGVLGGAALIGLWIVWGIVVLLSAWSAWAIWRGAA